MTPELHQLLVSLVVESVEKLIAARKPGHCLRVDELPAPLADDACRDLQKVVSAPNLVLLVRADPVQPWHVTPTAAVTKRNEEEGDTPGGGVLAVFIPPDSRLSVEDSIGASTFEVARFDDLGVRARRAAQSAAELHNPQAAGTASMVVEELLRDSRYHCSDLLAAEYLLRVASSADRQAAGVELGMVGLLPDHGLADLDPFSQDELRRRLQVNGQQMEALEAASHPAERLRNLPIDRDTTAGKTLVHELMEALEDGSTDRFVIAGRLRSAADDVDFGKWNLDTEDDEHPRRFEVTGLCGDFDNDSAEPTIHKPDPAVGVKFICEPAAAALLSAHALRLDVLGVGRDLEDVFETGVSAVKLSLPRVTSSTWKRKISVGTADAGLEAGLYRFRLVLLARDGIEIATALGPVFRVGDDIETRQLAEESVLGLSDAAVKAILDGLDVQTLSSRTVTFDEGAHAVSCHVRYEGSAKSWAFQIPLALADFESQLLSDPSLRGFEVDIDSLGGGERWLRFDAPPPSYFLEARTTLFEKILASPVSEHAPIVSVLLSNLGVCRAEIEAYIAAWQRALDESDDLTAASLLSLDQVHLREQGELVGILIAPTHPLRLAWLTRFDEVMEGWVTRAGELSHDELLAEVAELAQAIDEIVPLNLPPVVLEGRAPFRAIDALSRAWGLWTPVDGTDHMATSARARAWLDLPTWRLGATGETELVGRTRAYLEAHPYVRRLLLNVVQPGEGDLVLRLLGQLTSQEAFKDLTFVVRLFGDAGDATLGRALDAFMLDPEGSTGAVKRDVAENLTRPSADPLSPKLSYSKHDVSELMQRPEFYPAHISVFLDSFAVEAAALPEPPAGRSLFAGGIIVEPVQQYMPGDDSLPPSWVNAVTSDDEGLVFAALGAVQKHTARLMGGAGIDPTPALRLEIDSVRQAVLDAVHRSSDWVVTIDAVFSDEFLDRPNGDGGQPTYVIDMQSGTSRPGGRNVVVSSRVRDEQSAPIAAAANRFGFDVNSAQSPGLMKNLHALGAGVALRLLMDERRGKEALSLALAAAHLKASGVLRHALVIPVDMHQDLFAEALHRGISNSISRTDLAVFQLDPVGRRIGIHLVEVKVRSTLGASGDVPDALAAEIRGQLENTEAVLRQRLFGAQLRGGEYSLAGALQLRRLTVLLRRYLGRAARHDLIPEAEAREAGVFIESLQQGFSIGTSLHGLVFNAGAEGGRVEDRDGVQMTVLGSDYVRELLSGPEPSPTVIAGRGKDEYLQTVFRTVRDWSPVSPTPVPASLSRGTQVSPTPVDGTSPPVVEPTEDLPLVAGPALADVELLGAVSVSEQFGIIGVQSSNRRPVAIDMWGTNVISVFGVQGSGKSYTVGALLEAALIREPAVNRLPAPLGGVVFHYSANQSYLAEFVSMQQPNSETYREALQEYGASPIGLDDVVVLVPDAVLERRRREYPESVQVAPIHIGADELQLGDWKMLMGIAEGNQMYAKSMSLLLGELRDQVTLTRLRAAIENSDLSTSQKSTALQRIRFTEPYLRDGADIASVVRPGRLVVVDLRDELIDKGEALALFMVLLNRFTQATDQGRKFNKIIVFDEAHKYMDDPALTNAITEAVREMRHKGASIVIASQDPPSVPQEIIELSSVIIAHKFTSPAWLRHLQKVSSAFADMRGSQFNELTPGRAYVWAGNGRFGKPQRVEMRPRLTLHGGETRRATQ